MSSNNVTNPVAELTIFTRPGCGHCDTIKGVITDAQGNKIQGSDGCLGLLIGDQELKQAKILVREYRVVRNQDPQGHSNEEFQAEYNSKRSDENQIRGFPRVELSLPGDKINGKKFDRWVTWKGKRGADSIKAWVLDIIQEAPFNQRQNAQNVSQKGYRNMGSPMLPYEKSDFRAQKSKKVLPKIVNKSRVPEPIAREEVMAQRTFLAANDYE